MFKPHFGKCTGCNNDRFIVVKKGLCKQCNERQKNESKGRTQKEPRAKKEATGEGKMFMEIWAQAARIGTPMCYACRRSLGDTPRAFFFAHILGKGAYPSLRLEPRNLRLLCWDCHQGWDFGDKAQPKFRNLRQEAQILKMEYYEQQQRRNREETSIE